MKLEPIINWQLAVSAASVPIFGTIIYLIFNAVSNSGNKSSKKKYYVLEDCSSHGVIESDNKVIAWNSLGLEQPLVIAMVGLPARGKSYIVKMLIRYLKWTGYECEVFNVGSYRRKLGLASAESNFFDNNNKEGQIIREKMAMAVQDDMYIWLQDTGNKRVAIFDATNTTIDRRAALIQRARRENVFLLFVESICDDQQYVLY